MAGTSDAGRAYGRGGSPRPDAPLATTCANGIRSSCGLDWFLCFPPVRCWCFAASRAFSPLSALIIAARSAPYLAGFFLPGPVLPSNIGKSAIYFFSRTSRRFCAADFRPPSDGNSSLYSLLLVTHLCLFPMMPSDDEMGGSNWSRPGYAASRAL